MTAQSCFRHAKRTTYETEKVLIVLIDQRRRGNVVLGQRAHRLVHAHRLVENCERVRRFALLEVVPEWAGQDHRRASPELLKSRIIMHCLHVLGKRGRKVEVLEYVDVDEDEVTKPAGRSQASKRRFSRPWGGACNDRERSGM